MRAPESWRCPVCGDDHLRFLSYPPFGIRKGWFCPNCAARYTGLKPGRLLSVPGTEIVLSEVIDATENSRPPTAACFLLDLLLRKADRKAIPGDLEEEFRARIEKYSQTGARLWFWGETVRTLATRNPVCRWILVGGLMRLVGWIFRQIGS
jgi:rubredoxin